MKGWLLAAVLAALLATAAGSFWAGMHWQSGNDARDQLADTRNALKASRRQLTDYQAAVKDAGATFERNASALRAIAEDNAHASASQQQFTAQLSARLARYLDAHSVPAGCGLDADGLRIWNDANRGAAAGVGPASAGTASGSVAAAAVPESSGGRRRAPADAAAQPPGNHRPVPHVPDSAVAPRGLGQGAFPAAVGASRLALLTGGAQ